MRAPISRPFSLLALTSLVLATTACQQATAPRIVAPPTPDPVAERPIVAPPPQNAQAPRGQATVYHVVNDDAGSRLEPRTVPAGETTATPEETAIAAIAAMAAQKDSPLPPGTRALSVSFGDALATIDLSRQFKENFAGGDENEALAINAILATLGQFPGIRQVQILVEGKKIDAIGGTQTLDQPLQVPQNPARPRHTAAAK